MNTSGTAHKISAPIFTANSKEVTIANCEDSPNTKPQLSPKGRQALEKSTVSVISPCLSCMAIIFLSSAMPVVAKKPSVTSGFMGASAEPITAKSISFDLIKFVAAFKL